MSLPPLATDEEKGKKPFSRKFIMEALGARLSSNKRYPNGQILALLFFETVYSNSLLKSDARIVSTYLGLHQISKRR